MRSSPSDKVEKGNRRSQKRSVSLAQGSLRSVAEEHLLTLLQMVNEWLRFAETKNAGLLAFSGLSVTAVLSFTAQVDEFESKWGEGFLVFGSALWLVSAVITALSFVPKSAFQNPS